MFPILSLQPLIVQTTGYHDLERERRHFPPNIATGKRDHHDGLVLIRY
jgi:hypothetical protein